MTSLRDEAELRQSLVVEVGEQHQQQQQQQPEKLLNLEIKAPSALPEGYQLRVQLNDGFTKLQVPVPAGGVEANQVFRVVVPNPAVKNHESSPTGMVPHGGPVGHWKDGLLDIFRFGVFHPHVVTSLACSLLAAGQVIQRLKFTWHGTPAASNAESARAFDIIFYITLFHWFMIITMWLALATLDDTDYTLPSEMREPHTGFLLLLIILFDFFKYLYFILNVYILIKLRVSIRQQSAIPGTVSQDACQTLWCPCLTAAQLLRHTTSYEHVPARFCTRTGLLEDDDDELI